MSNKPPPDDDDVGYKKPPKKHQWKKGQSGNPSGRKPGAPSLKNAIRSELSATVSVYDGRSRSEITKMEALAKRLVADALSGDARMLIELLRQINIHLSEPAAGEALPASEEDAELLLAYVRRATGLNLVDRSEDDDESPSNKF